MGRCSRMKQRDARRGPDAQVLSIIPRAPGVPHHGQHPPQDLVLEWPGEPGVPEELVNSTAAMGLLTGDALWALSVAVAVFLLLVDLMHRRQRWAARYPPGPLPLPGLGNLLQIDFQNMPSSFQKMRFRFGDVFSLQLAWKPVIVLNGLAAVREALVSHSEYTSDRPWMSIYHQLGFGPRSQGVILASYGPAWREQRRFSLSTMRNFGLGKKSLERWVTEEASCLCTAFANKAGSPFSPMSLLKRAVCNVISSLIYARRFEYDDQRLAKMLDLLEDTLKEDSGLLPMVLNVFPVLLRIPGLLGKVFPAQKAFMAMVDELLEEHRMTWDPAQPPRDLTDAFLAEVEKAKGNPESSFNDENLRIVVLDLFSAGMVTTATTLAWALLLMILHPDMQRCVQQEIDEVIGQVRQPEMGDQARMPFTMAVIHEVQRFGDLVPLGVPHLTTRDIELQGFFIPKGTTLITNLSSVLKDETVWEKPLRFHPGHFLDAQGHFVKREAFMPFSAVPHTGRRVCLGEPLARMELFLFFTCLLQHFSFSVPPGQARPSDYGVFGTIVTPSPYQLCAEPR
ncbi:cytochrome P450 2D17-like isoform 3-T3 [Urocitellus parryii]